MSREIRRLHRKQTSFTNYQGDDVVEADIRTRRRRRRRRDINDSVEPVVETTQSQPEVEEVVESVAFPTVPQSNNISSIRAELQEDEYHRELSLSDFSDDTHDWGGDSDSCSDEYWSFVGMYE